jgi:hypothetical protein
VNTDFLALLDVPKSAVYLLLRKRLVHPTQVAICFLSGTRKMVTHMWQPKLEALCGFSGENFSW